MRYELVLWVDDPKPVFTDAESLGMEIKPLIEDYTMGYVTVTVEPAENRVRELEGIISGNIDQWTEAKGAVSDLLANWEQGDIAGPVNDLRMIFDLNNDGSDDR